MPSNLTVYKLATDCDYLDKPEVRNYSRTSLPLAEPPGASVATALAQAIAASHGEDWHRRGLSPLRYGDIVMVDKIAWLLVPPAQLLTRDTISLRATRKFMAVSRDEPTS